MRCPACSVQLAVHVRWATDLAKIDSPVPRGVRCEPEVCANLVQSWVRRPVDSQYARAYRAARLTVRGRREIGESRVAVIGDQLRGAKSGYISGLRFYSEGLGV